MTREETLKKIKEYLKGKGINIESIVNERLIIETIEQSIPDNDNFKILDIHGVLTIVYESQNWKKLQMNNTTMDLDLSKVYLTIKVSPDGKLVIKYGDLSYIPELEKIVKQNVLKYDNSEYEFTFNADDSVNLKIMRISNSVTIDKFNSKIAYSMLNGRVMERVFNKNGFELRVNTKNYEDTCKIDLGIIPLQWILTVNDKIRMYKKGNIRMYKIVHKN